MSALSNQVTELAQRITSSVQLLAARALAEGGSASPTALLQLEAAVTAAAAELRTEQRARPPRAHVVPRASAEARSQMREDRQRSRREPAIEIYVPKASPPTAESAAAREAATAAAAAAAAAAATAVAAAAAPKARTPSTPPRAAAAQSRAPPLADQPSPARAAVQAAKARVLEELLVVQCREIESRHRERAEELVRVARAKYEEEISPFRDALVERVRVIVTEMQGDISKETNELALGTARYYEKHLRAD